MKEAKERIKELEGTEDRNRSILRIADDNQSMAEEETKESKSEETQPLKKEPCAEANETDDPNESDPTEQVMADHKPDVEDEKVAEEKEEKFVPKREQDDEDDEYGEEEDAAEEQVAEGETQQDNVFLIICFCSLPSRHGWGWHRKGQTILS